MRLLMRCVNSLFFFGVRVPLLGALKVKDAVYSAGLGTVPGDVDSTEQSKVVGVFDARKEIRGEKFFDMRCVPRTDVHCSSCAQTCGDTRWGCCVRLSHACL